MKLTRRRTLQMLLTGPFAIFGLKATGNALPSNPPSVLVRGHCGICRHYVPPRRRGFVLDGPPDAYCNHRYYCKDYYLYDELIDELKLHRKPKDSCELFELRKDLVPV